METKNAGLDFFKQLGYNISTGEEEQEDTPVTDPIVEVEMPRAMPSARDTSGPNSDFFKQLGYNISTGEEDTNTVDRTDVRPYEGVVNSNTEKLKKDDLLRPENINVVRTYMGQKYGTEGLRDKSDEELVESFVDTMRYFNTNTFSTASEARRIKNADEEERVGAGQAFELYDRLGNVFVNDGVMGAIDGVKDYIFAAAKDPINYIGLLTGGLAKATALGVTTAGKEAVKALAREAGEAALKKGLTKEAQQAAVDAAVSNASAMLTKRAIREPARKKLLEQAAKREKELFEFTLKRRGEQEFTDKLVFDAVKGSVKSTVALDSAASVLNDIAIQNTLIEVGAQEEFSLLQTGFSSLLGGIGGAIQLAGMKLPTRSGLEGIAADVDIGKMRSATTRDISLALDKTETKQATAAVLKAAKSWKEKVKRGKAIYEDAPTSVNLLQDIMFGEDKKGGLVAIYREKGVQLPQDMKVTDLMTNLVQYMAPKELADINKEIKSLGISLGDTTQVATNLRDLVAVEVSKGAQMLNVMSQVRKTIDGGVYRGEQMLADETKEVMKELSDTPKYLSYTQGLWRRMLVSSPATSAINVAGFAQFFGGTTIAEILTSSQLLVAGVARGGMATKEGAETLRKAAVYRDMIGQKLRYLADPYSTKEAYMRILEEHEGVRKTLYESLTGGVGINSKVYGINEENKLFQNLESLANGSAIVAGVRVQDTWSKSLMFISEMDKRLRLKHGASIEEVLRGGKLELIDDDVLGKTLDITQKAVFSKNYTEGQGELVEKMAKLVEGVSNTPLLGTILPFGRFMNNVVATSWQWSFGGLGYASAIMKKNPDVDAVEAFSRSLVGLSFLTLAADYDKERQKDNLGVYDVKVGDNIVNAQNTFPMSIFLAAGRLINQTLDEGQSPKAEVIKATLEQLAVGQVASDIEFGNDITALFSALLDDTNDLSKIEALIHSGSTKAGNIAAGFTRPVDAVNKLVGFMANNDVAKDVRQARGGAVITQSATKYVDNIIELLLGESETITGTALRVATREGDLRDPNPLLSVLGIKVREGRTVGEEIYDKLDIPRYKANKRSQVAAYDRAWNEYVAPMVNDYAGRLLSDPEYLKLPPDKQDAVWATQIRNIRTYMKDFLENADTPEHIEGVRLKATAVKTVHKKAALKYLTEEEGFNGSIRDMTYPELQAFFTYVDFHKSSLDW